MATSSSSDNQAEQIGAAHVVSPLLSSIQTPVVPIPVENVSSRQSLIDTATLLKTSTQSSLLKSIASITSPLTLIHIPFPPIHFNSIAYTLPLGSTFRTAQGQDFAVSARFNLSGPATPINFTYSGLPSGVTPVTSSVSFAANANRRIFLNFTVARNVAIMPAKPFIIHYSGYNGLQKGDIPLTLAIWSGFNMQHQLESEWCWAATSTSVDHFYNVSSTVTQCQVVNHQLGRSDCCSNGGSSACNSPGYLDKALSYLNRLDHMDSSTESYATVVNQTSAWHPLGIRVAWSGGGAHFIAATGYEQGQVVVIDDPLYGPSVVSYNTLMGTYQGSGNWTHSYFTKP
jgi:Papain-like cysteine protease AvrRpt2